MLLGGGRLICGQLRLLLLLLPGGGLLWRLLVGARGLLRGPVARLLLVGLRVLPVAWVLQVHRSKKCEVVALGLQLRGRIRLWDWLSGIVTTSVRSWPCAAAVCCPAGHPQDWATLQLGAAHTNGIELPLT